MGCGYGLMISLLFHRQLRDSSVLKLVDSLSQFLHTSLPGSMGVWLWVIDLTIVPQATKGLQCPEAGRLPVPVAAYLPPSLGPWGCGYGLMTSLLFHRQLRDSSVLKLVDSLSQLLRTSLPGSMGVWLWANNLTIVPQATKGLQCPEAGRLPVPVAAYLPPWVHGGVAMG